MSDGTVRLGKQGALRSTGFTYRPGRGTSSERIFTGSESYIMGLFQSLSAEVSAEVDSSEAPLWKLRVRSPEIDENNAEPQLTTTWELLSNMVERDLKEHPSARNIDPKVMAQIDSILDDPTYEDNHLILARGDDGEAFLELERHGTTKFSSINFVLRRSMLASLRYKTEYSLEGVSKLWTTDQLKTKEAVPPTLIWDIGHITAPAERAGYLWSWLKMGPSITQSIGGRWQIVQEWWLEHWSTWIYKPQP